MYKSELNELGYKFWFSVLVNHYVRSGRAENPDQKVTKLFFSSSPTLLINKLERSPLGVASQPSLIFHSINRVLVPYSPHFIFFVTYKSIQ